VRLRSNWGLVIARPASFEVLAVSRDALGEGPWWSVADQTLTWVDIRGHKVRRSDLSGAGEVGWNTPSDVGFAIPGQGNHILLGLRSGLSWLDPGTGKIDLDTALAELGTDHRPNDGKTDRFGRVWFGSMHDAETDATSRLYRYDASGVATVLRGITTSNGLGWSPDNSVMYHTDSIARRIMAYRFDPDSGRISAGRVFAEDPAGYVPDGLTVDAEGYLWSAKWDGGKVVRYAPDGRAVLELEFPVLRPTSCMFVGSDLGTLAVTSAFSPSDDTAGQRLAGSVFLVHTGVRGLPEHPALLQGRANPAEPAGGRRNTSTQLPSTATRR
jgi:L-arabinonolactonase